MSQNIIEEARARLRLPTPKVRRAIRESTGTSQAAIARELGVSRLTVCRWEAGTRTPRGQYLLAYTDLLSRLRELS